MGFCRCVSSHSQHWQHTSTDNRMSKLSTVYHLIRHVTAHYKTLTIVLSPILLLPLPLLLQSQAASCAYIIILMGIYWLSSALPLAVTSLIPVVLLPVFGVMDSKTVASHYMSDTSMMLMGGMMIAITVEKSMLHKRVALKALIISGSKPSSIVIGMMIQTWFLSMWISNTATAAMMLPIADAVVEQLVETVKNNNTKSLKNTQPDNYYEMKTVTLEKQYVEIDETKIGRSDGFNKVSQNGFNNLSEPSQCGYSTVISSPAAAADNFANSPSLNVNADVSDIEQSISNKCDQQEAMRCVQHFAKMLSLAVSYSATTGGTATLTGSPPNLVFAKIINSEFETHGLSGPITFSSWITYGFPHAVVCLMFTWLWLQLFFLGWRSLCLCRKETTALSQVRVDDLLRNEYNKLGPVRFDEIASLMAFILIVVLWFARDPGFLPGYSLYFKKGYVSDGWPAILVAILLFIIPSQKPSFHYPDKKFDGVQLASSKLLDWQTVSEKMAWVPIFILGGGFAIADACQKSGLSKLIGNQLESLNTLPGWLMVLLIVTLVAMLTEVTSNTAVVTLVCPLLVSMSLSINVHPLYVTLPATMAASYAFMLPVATPVNAVVFSHGHVTILDMMKTGAILNVGCILIGTLGIHTLGWYLFGMSTLPWQPPSLPVSTELMNSTAHVAHMTPSTMV